MKNNKSIMLRKLLIGIFLVCYPSFLLQADYLRNDIKMIVLDSSSGLIWQDDNSSKNLIGNWSTAITTCENLILGGYTDWRLPNFNELNSITSKTSIFKSIKSTFINIADERYWSSTTMINSTGTAWTVNFSLNSPMTFGGSNKNDGYNIRCVRGGF